MEGELTVRLQTLDGEWKVCGHDDGYPAVVPEGFAAGANDVGHESCSFQLHRPANNAYADLSAFTPCEAEIDGTIVFEGRVREAPQSEGAEALINVTGVGRQANLDDDLFEKRWVHQRLADWVDTRSLAITDLTRWTSALAVQNDGAIVLGAATGTVWSTNHGVGVTIDLRDWAVKPKRIAIDLERVQGAAAITLTAREHNGDALTGGAFSNATGINAFAFPSIAAAPGSTVLGTLPGTHDYLTIYLYNPNVTYTAGGDDMVRLKAIKLFTDAAYESGGNSCLRASTVIKDAIDAKCPLLKSPTIGSSTWLEEILGDPSTVQAFTFEEAGGTTAYDEVTRYDAGGGNGTYSGGFTLGQPGLLDPDPDYTRDRAVLFNGTTGKMAAPLPAGVNSSGGGTFYIEAVFKPTALPSTGCIAYCGTGGNGFGMIIGSGSGASGSKLLILLPGGAGWVDSTQTLVAGTTYHAIAARDFDGNLRVWVNGTLVFNAAAAAPTNATTNTMVGADPSGAASRFFQGTIGKVAIGSRAVSATVALERYKAARAREVGDFKRPGFALREYVTGGRKTPREIKDVVNAFHRWRFRIAYGGVPKFGPQPNAPEVKVGAWRGSKWQDASSGSGEEMRNKVVVEGGGADGQPVVLERTALQADPSMPTLIDRRGFTRTTVLSVASVTIDPATARQLADIFLSTHRRTPMKGALAVTGRGGARGVLTDEQIPTHDLLGRAGEILRFDHLVDPDSAAAGRDGIMVGVAYTHRERQATIQIDNDRNSLEALLARMAIVQGAS